MTARSAAEMAANLRSATEGFSNATKAFRDVAERTSEWKFYVDGKKLASVGDIKVNGLPINVPFANAWRGYCAMNEEALRADFERCCLEHFQAKRAASVEVIDDNGSPATPEALFWREADGSYGVKAFNIAWIAYQWGARYGMTL